MRRSLPIRFAVSLFLCGLVGLGLAVLTGGNDPWMHRATVVTTSSGTVAGSFRGTSSDGIVLGMAEHLRVIPWNAVTEVSFSEGSATGSPSPSPIDPLARFPTRSDTAPTEAADPEGAGPRRAAASAERHGEARPTL